MLKWLTLITFLIITPSAYGANECVPHFNDNGKNLAPNKGTSIALPESTIDKLPIAPILNLPEELRPLGRDILLLVLGKNVKTEEITVNREAAETVDLLRLSGLATEAEIQEIADRVIDKAISGSYTRLLPQDKLMLPPPQSRNQELVISNKKSLLSQIIEKYNLHNYDAIHKIQEKIYNERGLIDKVSNFIDLQSAYKLAFEVKNPKIRTVLRDLLYFREYEDAIKAADRVRDDNALINIGLLAINDYLSAGSHYLHSGLYYAVRALGLVQGVGKEKELANQILFDLATLLASKEHVELSLSKKLLTADDPKYLSEKASIEQYLLQKAIEALTNSGELVYKYEDGGHIMIVTKVTNPKHRKILKALIDKFESAKYIENGVTHVHAIAKMALGDYSHYQTKYVLQEIKKIEERKQWLNKQADSFGLTEEERAHPLVRRIIREYNWHEFNRKNASNSDYERFLKAAQKSLDEGDRLNSQKFLEVALATQKLLSHDQTKKLPKD